MHRIKGEYFWLEDPPQSTRAERKKADSVPRAKKTIMTKGELYFFINGLVMGIGLTGLIVIGLT